MCAARGAEEVPGIHTHAPSQRLAELTAGASADYRFGTDNARAQLCGTDETTTMRPRSESPNLTILLAALRRGEQHDFHTAAGLLGLTTRNARPFITLAREAEGVYVARWARDRQGPPYPVLAWSMKDREDAVRPNSADRQRANRRRRELAKKGFGGLVVATLGVGA